MTRNSGKRTSEEIGMEVIEAMDLSGLHARIAASRGAKAEAYRVEIDETRPARDENEVGGLCG
jgi:hypothetical protein